MNKINSKIGNNSPLKFEIFGELTYLEFMRVNC